MSLSKSLDKMGSDGLSPSSQNSFKFLFVLTGFTFLASGLWSVFFQHSKISQFHPIEAKILSKTIRTIKPSSSRVELINSYKPIIQYSYEIKGVTYTSQSTTPFDNRAGHAWQNKYFSLFGLPGSGRHFWAKKILNLYTIGKKNIAYYNPHRPSESFLIKTYDFGAYGNILIGLLVLVGCYGNFKFITPQDFAWIQSAPKLHRSKNGVLHILPSNTISSTKNNILLTFFWIIIGGTALGHYFLVSHDFFHMLPILALLIYLPLLAVMLIACFKEYDFSKHLKTIQLEAKHSKIYLGKPLSVRLAMQFANPRRLENLSIGLIGYKSDVVGKINYLTEDGDMKVEYTSEYEEWSNLLDGIEKERKQTISFQENFLLPENGQPSSSLKDVGFPRYDWVIEVKIKILDLPIRSIYFPLPVLSIS